MAGDEAANPQSLISVKCPHCGETYRAPREAADRAFKCRKCGGAIQISGIASVGNSPTSGGNERNAKPEPMHVPVEPADTRPSQVLHARTADGVATEDKRRLGRRAAWLVISVIVIAAATAELLVLRAIDATSVAADWFVRPAFGCISLATVVMAIGLVGQIVVNKLNVVWLSFTAFVTWSFSALFLVLLFVVPKSNWFPYAPTEMTYAVALVPAAQIATILIKYLLLIPLVMMVGFALFGANSPVSRFAWALVVRVANVLWLPFQGLIFLWHAPHVSWIRKRSPAVAARLEKRVTHQCLQLGAAAESVLPKHFDSLPDASRQTLMKSAELAAEIQAWLAERGQDEDHGIKQVLEAAAGVVGKRLSNDQNEQLQTLQVDYDKAVQYLGLKLLRTPDDILRETELTDEVCKVRGAKEILALAETAADVFADHESVLPLAVRSAFCTLRTAKQELEDAREKYGLTQQKGLSQAWAAASSVLRSEKLTLEQQAELNALTSKQELAIRQLGLASASAPGELLREAGLEKQAAHLQDSRDVLDLGHAVEALLKNAPRTVPERLAKAAERAADALQQVKKQEDELGTGRKGSGVKKVWGAAASTFRHMTLSSEQKAQLESLQTRREQALKHLGAAMLSAPEALFDELGLTPRLQKLRNGKEMLSFGEACRAAFASRREDLPAQFQRCFDAAISASNNVRALRESLGLDRAKGITQALGAATSQLRHEQSAEQKHELDILAKHYDEAKRSLGVALLCATGDWQPPQQLAADIDKLRRGKLITQLGKLAEKTLPKYKNKLATPHEASEQAS